MVEMVLLAIGLSMDAFAVSVGLGAKQKTAPARLALQAGVYFGGLQALMPLLGYLGGKGALGWLEHYANWVGLMLLVLIGSKMIYESCSEGIETDISRITHRVMLVLAIATSVDALAVGFTLALLNMDPWVACAIIGVSTFGLSVLGVLIGAQSGAWLERKAELLGGVILVLMGLSMAWA